MSSHPFQRNQKVANPQLSLAVGSQEQGSRNRGPVDHSLAQL